MYSPHAHGRMIADRIRLGAYRRALEEVVTPGAVVVDIGTGTGILAVLACQFGARKVYAIENDEIIELARRIAKDNGCHDRIEFIRDLSTRVELPEKADVVVADIHGALPLYCGCMEALVDARKRFLKPGGAMIPRTEHIWIAVADLPEKNYADAVEIWSDGRWGVDLSAGRRFGTDWDFTADLTLPQLATQPACVATLNYHNFQSPSFSEPNGVQAYPRWQRKWIRSLVRRGTLGQRLFDNGSGKSANRLLERFPTLVSSCDNTNGGPNSGHYFVQPSEERRYLAVGHDHRSSWIKPSESAISSVQLQQPVCLRRRSPQAGVHIPSSSESDGSYRANTP